MPETAPIIGGEEEAAFIAARASTDRSAWRKWLKTQSVNPEDDVAVATAIDQWRILPLLQDPALLSLSVRALAAARGRRVGGNEPFPSTIWLGGATDTRDGRDFLGTVSDFADKLLVARARALAPKRSGWIIEPTTNTDGRRTNASTIKMHALFLDADGTGAWDALLAALTALDFCFIAYQSGGWTREVPKWRVVLPLHEPHDTRTEAGQLAWKAIYNQARVVFGSAGKLLNVGFDPATETPCCPWFLTEKRSAGDPERKILWRLGHALDLTALAIELPPIEIEAQRGGSSSTAREITLDEERLNVIIDALARSTNSVPSGRRDLYLALPGALLDRGLAPDDVMTVIEAVSASYPRVHADKHADNLHNARTTIAKWETGGRYTRIGTLNEVAPIVAAALDSVLPDLAARGIAESIDRALGVAPCAPGPSIPVAAPPTKRRGKLSETGRLSVEIAANLKKTTKLRQAGQLIGCLAAGTSLPSIPETSPDELVASAMRALGRSLPLSAQWQDVLDFASASLSMMGITQSTARVAFAERAFYEGRGRRHRLNSKNAAETGKRMSHRSDFFHHDKKGR